MINWHKYVIDEYTQSLRSTSSLGKELGKNPKTIRDILQRNGVAIRNRSQAQKIVIERDGPPVKGPRSTEAKRKISEGVQRHWSSLSKSAEAKIRKDLSKRAKKQWSGLSKKEKEDILTPMRIAGRQQAGQGSRAENKIGSLLQESGFKIEKRNRSVAHPYEIDILILSEGVAIECDGPTHFYPIHGEENLLKTQMRDGIKDAFITRTGLHVVRIQDFTTSYSRAACRRAVLQLEELMEEIKNTSSKVHYIIMK